MRKLNLGYSLKRTVVLLTLLASGFSEAVAQCPKGVAGKPPGLPSLCFKWTFDFDANNPQHYLSTFPDNCDDTYADSSGNPSLGCYWRQPTPACQAFIQDSNPTWTFIDAVKSTGDNGIYRCRYKIRGSQTIFDDHVVRYAKVPHLLRCDTVVNGPYKNCSDTFILCGVTYTEAQPGFQYTTAQKNTMKERNQGKHGGKLVSDLAGYRFPKSALPPGQECLKIASNDSTMCEEPSTPLNDNTSATGERDYPNVHHVMPRVTRVGCGCGKNSMKNAVIISRQLNAYFLNFPRPQAEIAAVNMAGQDPYTCAQAAPLPFHPAKTITRKKAKKLGER